jgi:hypothetical protein
LHSLITNHGSLPRPRLICPTRRLLNFFLLNLKELRDREQDIESGKSKFIDWEKAKTDIRRRTS